MAHFLKKNCCSFNISKGGESKQNKQEVSRTSPTLFKTMIGAQQSTHLEIFSPLNITNLTKYATYY